MSVRRKEQLCHGATAPPSGRNTSILFFFCLGLMLNVAKAALHRDDAEFIQPLHVKLE